MTVFNNMIIINGYTLPQLIWLVVIVAGLAVLAYGIWASARKPGDFLKDVSQYLEREVKAEKEEA